MDVRAVAFRGNRIEASTMQGVAPQQTSQRHQTTPQHSILGDRNDGIFRTRGLKPAGTWSDGMQRGGYSLLIESEQEARAGGARSAKLIAQI